MPAEAIMATANTSTLKYQNSAVFDPDSPPSQIKQQRNDKDFFESLAAEKPTHLEYLKNFRLIVFERKKGKKPIIIFSKSQGEIMKLSRMF